jgi:Concanavalin A-like lectin/glucanases superfamily
MPQVGRFAPGLAFGGRKYNSTPTPTPTRTPTPAPTATPTPTPTPTPAPNYSYYFPNTANTGADYAEYALNSNLILGTSDLTIESYVYLNSSTARNWGYLGSGDTTTNLDYTWHCFILSDYTVKLDIYYGTAVRSAAVITPNTWYYIAYVRNSGAWSIYINGVKDSNTYSDSTSLAGNGVVLGTTYYPPYNNQDFQGYLSNIRISKSALYSSNFTPPTYNLSPTGNTVVLTAQSNSFVDNSGAGQSISTHGSASTSTFAPF